MSFANSPSCNCCGDGSCPTCLIHFDTFPGITDDGQESTTLDDNWEVGDGDEWKDADKVLQGDASGGPSYSDVTTAANDATTGDWQFFPSGSGVDDAIYIGSTKQFDRIQITLDTPGEGTYALQFQYSAGAGWGTFGYLDDRTGSLKNAAGEYTVAFDLGASPNWGTATINGSLLYWVRIIRDAGTVTVDPIGSRVRISNWNQLRQGISGSGDRLLRAEQPGILVNTNVNPFGTPSRVACHVKGSSGQSFRLCTSYIDADNYLAVEVKLANPGACGTLSLIQRLSGSETTLIGPLIKNGFAVDQWHRMVICNRPSPVDTPLTRDNTGFIHIEATDGDSTPTAVDDSGDVWGGIEGTDITGGGVDQNNGSLFRGQSTSLSGPGKVAIQVIGAGTSYFDNFRFTTTVAFTNDAVCTISALALNDLTGLTSVSGSWSATSGTLSTSSVNAVILDDEVDTSKVRMNATVTLGSTSDVARLILSYLDADNYFYLEASASVSALRLILGRRISGTDTAVGTTVYSGFGGVSATDPAVLQFFQCERQVSYKLNDRDQISYLEIGADPPGTQAGLGTRATSSGVSFTDYETLHHRSTTKRLCNGYDVEMAACDICERCHQVLLDSSNTKSTDETGNAYEFDCRWESLSGTWVYTCSGGGGNFDCQASGSGEVLLRSQFPHLQDFDGNPQMFVEVNRTGSGAGHKLRIKVDYVDANNYLFAEYDSTVSPITVSVGKVVAGTETVLHTQNDEDGTATPYGNNGILVAYKNGSTNIFAGGVKTDLTAIVNCCMGMDDLNGTFLGNVAESPVTWSGSGKIAVSISDDTVTLESINVYDGCPVP